MQEERHGDDSSLRHRNDRLIECDMKEASIFRTVLSVRPAPGWSAVDNAKRADFARILLQLPPHGARSDGARRIAGGRHQPLDLAAAAGRRQRSSMIASRLARRSELYHKGPVRASATRSRLLEIPLRALLDGGLQRRK